MHGPHSHDWAIQVVKGALGDHRGDFRADAVPTVALVNDNRPRCLPCRFDQRPFIEWPGRPRVDHFCADAHFLQQGRRSERDVHHAAGRDDGDVATLALDIRRPEWHGVLVGRHRAFHLVHHLVFEEHDRIVVTDSALEQSFRIVWRRRQGNLEPRDVTGPGVKRLRVLGGRTSRGPERRSHDQRDLPRASRHVMNLRGLIDQLIHHQSQEIPEHDVDDRPQTRHRGSDANAGESSLGDWGIDDTLLSELLHEARQHLERGSRFGNVFPENTHPWIAAHLFCQGLPDGLAEAQLADLHWIVGPLPPQHPNAQACALGTPPRSSSLAGTPTGTPARVPRWGPRPPRAARRDG